MEKLGSPPPHLFQNLDLNPTKPNINPAAQNFPPCFSLPNFCKLSDFRLLALHSLKFFSKKSCFSLSSFFFPSFTTENVCFPMIIAKLTIIIIIIIYIILYSFNLNWKKTNIANWEDFRSIVPHKNLEQ